MLHDDVAEGPCVPCPPYVYGDFASLSWRSRPHVGRPRVPPGTSLVVPTAASGPVMDELPADALSTVPMPALATLPDAIGTTCPVPTMAVCCPRSPAPPVGLLFLGRAVDAGSSDLCQPRLVARRRSRSRSPRLAPLRPESALLPSLHPADPGESVGRS